MSFEKPERLLTKEEWRVLAQAAQDKARNYLNSSVTYYRDGEMKLASYYAEKANRIYNVLTDLESEYYKAHPEEDPDRRGKEYVHD